MTGERQPWEPADEPMSRDIFAAELVGDPGPDGRNPVAEEVGGWVSRAIERVRARLKKRSGESPSEEPARGSIVAGTATAAAVGALEGTLKGKSLEGALKEAQILDAYASARQKNAEAEKLEAEVELMRQQGAFERLERTIDLMERLGASVSLAQTETGQLAIVVGDNLVGEVPKLSATTELAQVLPTGQPDNPPPADVRPAPPTQVEDSLDEA